MKGIISYGVYLPYYRLKRETIFKAMSWFNPGTGGLALGEKSVANHDEDSLTMAVAAGMDCFSDVNKEEIGSLYLASTTFPNKERGNASIAGAALNFSPNIRTADFSGCLKAGTTALISALKEKGSGPGMVCASDSRLGKAGGAMEQLFGDGAAAMIVGNDGVIASLIGHHSVSYDFADQRRIDQDKFTRTWEERWIREQGYFKMVPEAIKALLAECDLKLSDISKVVFPPLSKKDHQVMAKTLGLGQETEARLFRRQRSLKLGLEKIGHRPTSNADVKAIFSLTLVHFIGDFYASFVNPLLPLFVERFSLTLTEVGLITGISRILSFIVPRGSHGPGVGSQRQVHGVQPDDGPGFWDRGIDDPPDRKIWGYVFHPTGSHGRGHGTPAYDCPHCASSWRGSDKGPVIFAAFTFPYHRPSSGFLLC